MYYNKQEIINKGWNKYKKALAKLEPTNILSMDTERVITDVVNLYYGNISLWWVLLEYNQIEPLPNVTINQELKLFSIRELDEMTLKHLDVLGQSNRRSL